MDQELPFLPITILSRELASRKLSPVELVQALIQRIEQVDGQLNAFITRTFERLRRDHGFDHAPANVFGRAHR